MLRFLCIYILIGQGFALTIQAQLFRKQAPEFKLRLKQEIMPHTCGAYARLYIESEGYDSLRLQEPFRALPLHGLDSIFITQTTDIEVLAWRSDRDRPIKRRIQLPFFPPKASIKPAWPPNKPLEGDTVRLSFSAGGLNRLYFRLNGGPWAYQKDSTCLLIPGLFEPKNRIDLMGIGRCEDTVFHSWYISPRAYTKVDVPSDPEASLAWRFGLTDSVRLEGYPYPVKVIDSLPYRALPSKRTIRFRVFPKEAKPYIKTIDLPDFSFDKGNFWGPPVAFVGDSVWLRWNFPYAQAVSLEDHAGAFSTTDSIKILAERPTTYYLRVDGKSGFRFTSLNLPLRKRRFIESKKRYEHVAHGEPVRMDIFDTRFEGDEMVLKVLVHNSRGEMITGIGDVSERQQRLIFREILHERLGTVVRHKDFQLREVSKQVLPPYQIGMALDYSGSMNQDIGMLEYALKKFLEKVPSSSSVGLIKFDHRLQMAVPWTDTKKEYTDKKLFRGLDTLGGGTALNAGISYGLQMLKNVQGTPVLMVWTDGMENSSGVYAFQMPVEINELAKMARAQGVKVVPVVIGNAYRTELQGLADATNGNLMEVYNPSDYLRLFAEIPLLEQHYYEIRIKAQHHPSLQNIRLVFQNEKGTLDTAARRMDLRKEPLIADTGSQMAWPSYVPLLLDGKKPQGLPQILALHPYDASDVLGDGSLIVHYANILKGIPNVELMIFSHADLKGSEAYCKALSLERAKALKQKLIELGVDGEKVHFKALGKAYPIHAKEYFSWQADENRRSEVVVYQP